MRIKYLSFIAFLLSIIISGCSKTSELRFATGSEGGNYYSIAQDAAKEFNQIEKSFQVSVRQSAGSMSNIRLLQENFCDVAFVQGDFKSQLSDDIEIAGTGYTECCQIIVRGDSDIFSIKDLKDHKVSVGLDDSGVIENARRILNAYGMSFDDIQCQDFHLNFKDSAVALECDLIDAFFCTAAVPAGSVEELSKSTNIRIISLDDEAIERIINLYHDCTYERITVPAGCYSNIHTSFTTIGTKVLVAARKDADKQAVERLVNILNKKEIVSRYSVLEDM